MSSFVVITGATGHIGGHAAELLIKKGVSVRAIARSKDKLAQLKGAEAVAADISDAAALTQAFKGAAAVFAMIPPDIAAPDVRAYQNRLGDSLISAITQSRVSHVVILSSLGAHLAERTGPIKGIYDWEQKLKKLTGVNILVLRPSYFMENLLVNIPLIKGQGIMGSPIRRTTKMAMIATRDIAAVVADALEKKNFSGFTIRELLGQRDITLEEARAAFGKAIGKPDLPYIDFPGADAEKAMVGMGLSVDYARSIVEMADSMNDGTVKPTQPRDANTTTPTSIETFAVEVFAPAFKSS